MVSARRRPKSAAKKVVASRKKIQCTPKDAQSIINTIRIDLNEGYTEEDALLDQESEIHDEIAREGQSTQNSNVSLLTQLQMPPSSGILASGQSALDLLLQHNASIPIITFSESLDNLLGGGVEARKITEFVGVPGIGKTQLSVQLSIDVQIPKIFGGAQGHCIYADTEGSVMPARVAEIAQATVEYLKSIADTEDKLADLESCTVESVLAGIEYYRVHDHIEQIALVMQLPDLIEEHNQANPSSPVRLVVIDSIAFHFRTLSDMAQRTRLLTSIANQLMSLAIKFDLAVVLTNQVTVRGGAGIVPALGETWSHNATVRVLLERASDSNSRRAKLIKSNSHEPGIAHYEIKPEGIR